MDNLSNEIDDDEEDDGEGMPFTPSNDLTFLIGIAITAITSKSNWINT